MAGMAKPPVIKTVTVQEFYQRFGKHGTHITRLRHPITGKVSLWHPEAYWRTPYQ